MQINPKGPENGGEKILRGGGYNSNRGNQVRGSANTFKRLFFGFRIVMGVRDEYKS